MLVGIATYCYVQYCILLCAVLYITMCSIVMHLALANLIFLQWTDDTSMALCLAESLIECRAFNPVDQTRRYWKWYEVKGLFYIP